MSMKVAIAGATGNLGPAVLKELLAAGFEVTALTRAGKKGSSSGIEGAKVVEVDYNSLESLTQALQGQQVVINTLGAIPREIHLRLIDAAVAAGTVQRYIPSEFGSDSTNPQAAKLPIYADKVAVQEYLRFKTTATTTTNNNDQFSYTLLFNGPFLDWCLKIGFLINLANPELYDGGNHVFSTTTLSGVGRGVCGIIRNLEATRNRAVYLREAELSQNQLLQLSDRPPATASRIVSTLDLEREAFTELEKPNPNALLFVFNFLRRVIFSDCFGNLFPEDRLDNALLGVEPLSEDQLRSIVSSATQENKT